MHKMDIILAMILLLYYQQQQQNFKSKKKTKITKHSILNMTWCDLLVLCVAGGSRRNIFTVKIFMYLFIQENNPFSWGMKCELNVKCTSVQMQQTSDHKTKKKETSKHHQQSAQNTQCEYAAEMKPVLSLLQKSAICFHQHDVFLCST